MQKTLKLLADADYRIWHMRLVNDDTVSFYGVRMPNLHKIARELAADNWQDFLTQNSWHSHEERMLACLLPQYIRPKLDAPTLFTYFEKLYPYLSNWALTDALGKKYPEIINNPDFSWDKIKTMLSSKDLWTCRLGIVLTLSNFAHHSDYTDKIITELSKIKTNEYYVKMAIAWCLAETAVNFTDKILATLPDFDPETAKMARQKMRDSFRVKYP